MREIVFWAFSGVAIASAVLCVTRRSAVASALWLIGTLFSLAALFVLLDAQFIGVLQVIVYAGAIMVLFLFVIMLLNLGRAGPGDMKGWGWRVVAGLLTLGLATELWALRGLFRTAAFTLPEGALAARAARQGAVQIVAEPLFRQYLVPFEVTSILLLAAVVGAVVLAKRRL
jgi:NADH-quinone oxidoreductase subunit J